MFGHVLFVNTFYKIVSYTLCLSIPSDTFGENGPTFNHTQVPTDDSNSFATAAEDEDDYEEVKAEENREGIKRSKYSLAFLKKKPLWLKALDCYEEF